VEKSLRVLVTGGAGFIGSNLVRSLLSYNHKVSVLDDFSTGLKSNISGLEVEVFEGSVANKKILNDAAKNVDSIVHLAARGSVLRSIRNPQATFDVNVQGTLNICEIAREQFIPVVFSSSSSVYGANTSYNKLENAWLSPLSPYAASKLSGEALMLSFANSFGIQTAVFRLFNVYGPGQRPEHQYSAVIPKWLWASQRGEELKVFGDGHTSRDFTFIDNVVEILGLTVMENRYFSGITNLAFGNPVTLLDVLSEIKKIEPKFLVNHYEIRQGDIRDSNNASKRLIELFPEVIPYPLEAGILRTSNWLRKMQNEIETHPLILSDD
jgi:UDP-glucose 4-epimerase